MLMVGWGMTPTTGEFVREFMREFGKSLGWAIKVVHDQI